MTPEEIYSDTEFLFIPCFGLRNKSNEFIRNFANSAFELDCCTEVDRKSLLQFMASIEGNHFDDLLVNNFEFDLHELFSFNTEILAENLRFFNVTKVSIITEPMIDVVANNLHCDLNELVKGKVLAKRLKRDMTSFIEMLDACPAIMKYLPMSYMNLNLTFTAKLKSVEVLDEGSWRIMDIEQNEHIVDPGIATELDALRSAITVNGEAIDIVRTKIFQYQKDMDKILDCIIQYKAFENIDVVVYGMTDFMESIVYNFVKLHKAGFNPSEELVNAMFSLNEWILTIDPSKFVRDIHDDTSIFFVAEYIERELQMDVGKFSNYTQMIRSEIRKCSVKSARRN